MKLSKQQFREKLSNNQLALTMIGMSNIGKSYWSSQLSKKGFNHYNIDDLLEKQLKQELGENGPNSLAEVAKWLGFPYEERFPENQKKLLNLENETTGEILLKLKPDENSIIDTPGSIIYGDHCHKLKEKTFIIYLQATPEMQKAMFENFLKFPKPILWQNIFKKETNEKDEDALARLYPKLLQTRSALYEKYADITIPYAKIAIDKTHPGKFLEIIIENL